MILLDASAMLSLLLGEPGDADVAALIQGADCATAAPCLSEAVDHLIRRTGVRRGEVVDRLEPLIDASLGILPTENRVAWEAGEIRAEHYERKRVSISLADCTILAVAGPNDKLATSDAALVEVAGKLGISVIRLPDSKGKRPNG